MPGSLPAASGPVHRQTMVDDQVAVQLWVPDESAPRASERPVVLALHGWTDGGAVFAPMAGALGDVCDVVAPDAPGHGGTQWKGSERFSFDGVIPSALKVMDALPRLVGDDRPLVLLGHSMGALTAARLAAARPDGVGWVILEEPPRRAFLARRDVRRDMASLRRVQQLAEDDRIALLANSVDWTDEELRLWAQTKATARADVLGTLRDWGEPLSATLPRVRCPVTLLLGRDGLSETSPRRARRYAARSGRPVEVVRLAGGHSPRREDLAGYVSVLRQILARSVPVR